MQLAKGICHISLHKQTTARFYPVKDLLVPGQKKYSPL